MNKTILKNLYNKYGSSVFKIYCFNNKYPDSIIALEIEGFLSLRPSSNYVGSGKISKAGMIACKSLFGKRKKNIRKKLFKK